MSDAPIGIFDSGVGGLTVARAVLDQLPSEPIYYVADTEHHPYGPKPIAQVRAHALGCLDHLVEEEDVKLLVIACNSASAAVLRDARERYDVPVVEVIKPATRRAARATSSGAVGLIATRATVTSKSYDDAFAAAPHIRLTSVACPRFVEFVERGVTMSDELLAVAAGYLRPIRAAGCDTLILGCTHYPLLTGVISYVVGDGVTLVSSAEETAKDVYRVLHDEGLARADSLSPPVHRFRATGDPAVFAELGRRYSLLLDLGNGALGPLQRHRSLYEIDAVCLTHLHADHCLDLCGYWVARRYCPDGPPPKIPVYGPDGTADRMARAYDLELDPGMREIFDFEPLRGGARKIGPFTVTTALMSHPVPCFGFRVEYDGQVVAYSGDTGASDDLVELARDADLFLCEASFLDGPDLPADLHLSARQAAEHAARAGAKKLILTHLVPWNDREMSLAEAKASCYEGEIELAQQGAAYELF
jgi:glutamate racemase